MKPPTVPMNFKISDLPLPGDRYINIYKLIKNLYGIKDVGRTWNEFLHVGLIKRGWEQSKISDCLYTKDGMIMVLYVNDACIISPDKCKIQEEIKSLQKDFDLTDDGELKDYIGTRFEYHNDGSITLTQPRMIEHLLAIVGLDSQDTNEDA